MFASAGGVAHGGGTGMSPRGGGGNGGGGGGVGVGEEDEERLLLREMPNGLRVWWSSRAEEEAMFVFGEVFEDRTYGRMGVRVQDGDTVWDVGEVNDVGNTLRTMSVRLKVCMYRYGSRCRYID